MSLVAFAALFGIAGCGGGASHRFLLREPMTVDDDERVWFADCKPDPTNRGHRVCAPPEYVSPFVWDGVDAMVFRPVQRFLAVDPAGESKNVNALDEVPDSSWFKNRLGASAMSSQQIADGPCEDDGLDPSGTDGAWVIDQGKENGDNPGFRVKIEGVGTYLLKADEEGHPERATGAAAIATRIYHAAGYFTSCDRVVYVRRSLLQLRPGLERTDNSGITRPFGEKQLDQILRGASRRGDRYRLVASKWLPGKPLGPFRYEGVRKDDPNDVVPHEDRRELRGQRVLAAWLGHFDAREQNSMTTWISTSRSDPDASPGMIRHYLIDFNDCFGSEWASSAISRRLNHAYYFDVGGIAFDVLTLGIPKRPWDDARRSPRGEIFGYFGAERFDPEAWKPGYQNPAFLRMTERDAAWMARILSRFTPEVIARLVTVGDFTHPDHAAFLTETLVARRQKILRRYFGTLSPIAYLETRGNALCGLDLARRADVFPREAFRWSATVRSGARLDRRSTAFVTASDDGTVCVSLPRIAGDSGDPDGAATRYFGVRIHNGASREPLDVWLYDLGPSRGYRIAGLGR